MYKIGIATIRNNRLLLCRPFAFEDLIMPGGVKEPGEDSITTLRREIHEELGSAARLDEKTLRYLGTFSDRAAGRTDRIVDIELYEGELSGPLVASSEIKELIWFDPSFPPRHKLSQIVERQIIPHLIGAGLLSAGYDAEQREKA